MDTCFSNKVALVTGAARGIGKAIADALHTAGAIVIRADIAFTTDASARCYKIDVSSLEQVRAVIAEIESSHGAIEFIAHAAAVLHLGEALEQNIEQWLDTFAVNTHGAFYVCQTVARLMVQRRRGAIVVVGSNAAHVPRTGMAAYAASKAASEQMLRCLGLEIAEFNVRCNLVAPGSTYTDMQKQCWQVPSDEQKVIAGDLAKFRLGIPLGRIACPSDIAHSVVFLLSQRARHITLQSLTVDAGATLGV